MWKNEEKVRGVLRFGSQPQKTLEDFNFYCFSDPNVNNPVELNFKNLKKCKTADYIDLLNNKQKFLVVDFDNIIENQNTNIEKKIQHWHNKNMGFYIQFTGHSVFTGFDSNIKSILHKGFSLPTTGS